MNRILHYAGRGALAGGLGGLAAGMLDGVWAWSTTSAMVSPGRGIVALLLSAVACAALAPLPGLYAGVSVGPP